jgi:hypothetical protein
VTALGTHLDRSAQPVLPAKTPMYWRLLRLRHVFPNAWQRALLGEGALALGAILVLADVASAWLLPVLPLSVALVVKANDVIAGWLLPDRPPQDAHKAPPEGDTIDLEERLKDG